MTRPIIRIHDIETNEVIDREMTVAEFKEHQANLERDLLIEKQEKEKAAQRQAIADRLGLTADELQVLLG